MGSAGSIAACRCRAPERLRVVGGALTADSVLIPVAYYVHHRKLTHAYRESPNTREDRDALRSWVLRSLIVRGVWGSGLDTLLRDLREAIRTAGSESFPLAGFEKAMALRGKSLAVTDELIEDVLNLEYGKPRTFPVLAALFPHVDTRNVHHVDHVFPVAQLQRKRLAALQTPDGTPLLSDADIAELAARRDRLPNLELLQGLENIGKSDQAPDVWLAQAYPSDAMRGAFLERNSLPSPLPHSATEFAEFYDARRDLLATLIRTRLQTQVAQPSPGPSGPLAPTSTKKSSRATSRTDARVTDQPASRDHPETHGWGGRPAEPSRPPSSRCRGPRR